MDRGLLVSILQESSVVPPHINIVVFSFSFYHLHVQGRRMVQSEALPALDEGTTTLRRSCNNTKKIKPSKGVDGQDGRVRRKRIGTSIGSIARSRLHICVERTV